MKSVAHGPAGRSLPRSRVRRSGRGPHIPALTVSVLIAYTDIAAARNAMARLNRQLSDTDCQLQPMLWRFDQFAHQPWREQALRDARRAQAVVLAISDTASLAAPADAWLSELAACQGGAPVNVLALLGTDEAWTISLQKTAVENRRPALQRQPAPAEPMLLAPASKRVAA